MENYRLEQTGQEVQDILNGAAMQTDLTAEVERAEGAEQTLQGNIDEEERRAKAAEETLSGAIGDEELRAKAAEEALGGAIDGINAKIPAAASSENKLADQDFVNSSIETATATFRGTYNLVSDLHLAVDATHAQIATLLGTVIAEADNNDYSYVLIPTSAQTPTEIASIEKYTFGANGWAFAYALNNSGFTSAQWAAINSGITSGLVAKLNALPTNTDLLALLAGKQDVLTFDDVPVEGSNNPVKSGGVHSAIDDEKTARVNAMNQLSGRVDTIEGEIPAQASSENQLADKAYVNSSISTNTATYRGSFNLVADLGLSVSATHEQIGTALAGEISTADNNDYAYVQVPTSDETPSQILKVERYKYNGTAWAFEYELNNSGFTAAQWAALNSGITSGLVAKLVALPTNDELTLALAGKQDVLTFDNTPTENSNNPVKSGGVYAADKALSDAIEAILLLIPSAATSLNKLVDTDLMNSSISTATATFRGTFNLVSDLSLDLTATHAQIATALAGEIATADNNDYAFVLVPTSVGTPTEIAQTDRYKFNGTAWAYEYTLNTSGFTSAQWAAINSGITAALVASLADIPDLIPSEATSANQLADKAYVLASILAATPAFKGQFTTLAELQAVASPKDGDLGIVRTKDSDGMDVFTVYQYLNNAWNVFYSLSYHPQTKPATTGTTGDYPYNGMGRVELAKNMVNTGTDLAPVYENQLTQDMFYKGAVGSRVPNTNTIFVIRYDYVLAENITIPDGCVLQFDGGSISGAYTLTGANTIINAIPYKIIAQETQLSGTYKLDNGWNVCWFGAVGDGVTDSTNAFRKSWIVAASTSTGAAHYKTNKVYIPRGNYQITTLVGEEDTINESIYGARVTFEGETKYGAVITCTGEVVIHNTVIGFVTFRNMTLAGDDNEFMYMYSGDGGGWPQGFIFDNVFFDNWHTIQETAGYTMTSEMTYSFCKIANCGSAENKCRLFIYNNPQGVNNRFVVTEIESFVGDLFYVKQTTSIMVIQGSIIPSGNVSTNECSLIHVPDDALSNISGNVVTFYGTRFEMRGYTNYLKEESITGGCYKFQDCDLGGFNLTSDSDFFPIKSKGYGKLTLQNCSNFDKVRCYYKATASQYGPFLIATDTMYKQILSNSKSDGNDYTGRLVIMDLNTGILRSKEGFDVSNEINIHNTSMMARELYTMERLYQIPRDGSYFAQIPANESSVTREVDCGDTIRCIKYYHRKNMNIGDFTYTFTIYKVDSSNVETEITSFSFNPQDDTGTIVKDLVTNVTGIAKLKIVIAQSVTPSSARIVLGSMYVIGS